MRIVKLQIENFMGIRAVELHPEGKSVTIAGRNGQGKTSLFNAIAAAWGGDKATPAEPIRRGAKSAEVLVETEEFTLVRRWTKSGSRFELTPRTDTEAGRDIRGRQELFDKAMSSLTFDPMAFLRMGAKERAAALVDLLGLREALEGHAATEKRLEEERRDARRDMERAKIVAEEANRAIASAILEPGAEPVPVDIGGLAESIKATQSAGARYDDLNRNIDRVSAELRDLEADLAACRRRIAELERDQQQHTDWLEGAKFKRAAFVGGRPDASRALAELQTAGEHNAKVARLAEARKVLAGFRQLDDKLGQAERALERAREERAEAIRTAAMPVAGMAFDGETVTLNGRPLENASTSEQMRASVALGLAARPELNAMFVRDGSLLDTESRAALFQIAEEYGAQIFLELATDGQADPSWVTIEAGEIAEPAEGKAV